MGEAGVDDAPPCPPGERYVTGTRADGPLRAAAWFRWPWGTNEWTFSTAVFSCRIP